MGAGQKTLPVKHEPGDKRPLFLRGQEGNQSGSVGTMRVAKRVTLSAEDRLELQALTTSMEDSSQVQLRVAIILAASEGLENYAIADRLKCSRRTVGLWRSRFVAGGIAALSKYAPRTGRKPDTRNRVEAEVLRRYREVPPPEGNRWTIRLMAREVGVSKDTVQRIWSNHGILPVRKRNSAPTDQCTLMSSVPNSSCRDSRTVSDHHPVGMAEWELRGHPTIV
jgi:transposase